MGVEVDGENEWLRTRAGTSRGPCSSDVGRGSSPSPASCCSGRGRRRHP